MYHNGHCHDMKTRAVRVTNVRAASFDSNTSRVFDVDCVYRCAGKGTGAFKTIANTFFLQNVAEHPHNFETSYVPLHLF